MQRFRLFGAAVALLLGGPAALAAQEPQAEPAAPPIVDSLVVEGNARSRNEADGRRLWEVSEQLTDVHYEFGAVLTG